MSTYYSLSASPLFAYCGQTQLNVSWSVTSPTLPNANDYIALFLVGSQTEAWRQSTQGGRIGSAQVPAPTPPGKYEFRYFDGATNEQMAVSHSVSVGYPSIMILAEGSEFAPYEPITIFWDCASPSDQDRIGLYETGAPSDQAEWEENTGGEYSGYFYPNAPITPGSYDVRYYWTPGDYVETSSPFPVVEETDYSLTASSDSVEAGQQITATWNAAEPSPQDTVGLFLANAPPFSTPIQSKPTNGAKTGALDFTAPGQAGQYQFRYMLAGSTAEAWTNPITVTQSTTASLTPNPDSVESGDQISLDWSASNPSATDAIGLFEVTAPDSSPLSTQPTQGATSGLFTFDAPTQAGQYEFRYLSDGTTSIAQSSAVTVYDPLATLTVEPGIVAPGDTITVTWTASEPNSDDVIGFYSKPVATGAPLQLENTNGQSSGTTSFTAPSTPGEYIILYLKEAHQPLAETSVTVGDPSEATVSLSAIPASVEPNVNLSVNWNSPNAGANDWIGLYRIGDRDSTPISSQPIGSGTSGTLDFTAPGQEGHYEFRYYVYNDPTPAARSNEVTVTTPEVSLAATPGSVPSGTEITVTWDAVNGSISDTIGLFAVDANDLTPIATQSAGAAPSGSLTFTAPSATGQYEFRYFFAGSEVSVARSNAVAVTPPQVSLTVSPKTVEPNGEVTVSWNATDTTANDEIGLYALDAVDASPLSYKSTGGDASNSLQFTAPAQDGDYMFRYLLNGTTALAHSEIVSVYGVETPPTTVADSLPDAVPRAELEEIIVNQAINDADFRGLLLTQPSAALTQLFGKAPPDSLTFTTQVEDGSVFYYIVPDITNEVVPSEDDWVLQPIVPPGEFQEDGIIEGPPQVPETDDPGPTELQIESEIEAAEGEERGPAEITSGLASLPEDTTTVGIVDVVPMAFTSRQNFKSQVNYLLATDSEFYDNFIRDARDQLSETYNYHFPDSIAMTPLVEAADSVYIVLPYAAHDAIFSPPYALEFQSPSSSYVSVTPTASLAIQAAITVEAWIKASAFHGDTDDVIVSTHQSNGGWELRAGGGVPRFVVNLDGTDYVAQPSDPRLTLDAGRWYYLAGVYDGSQVQLYLNDLVLPPTTASGQIGPNGSYLMFGRTSYDAASQNSFQGLIYDVRIWSEALTPDRVRSDFLTGRSETPAPQAALCAWYPMIEGAGTTLPDHSGNDNNGTMASVMWVSTYPDIPN